MTGHQSITALRMRGYTPSQVWVSVLDAEPEYFSGTHPERDLENGFLPGIDIGPAEPVQALDFRCLRGLTVHLQGTDRGRVEAIQERLLEFQPARVLASGFGELIDTEQACTTSSHY